MWIQLAVDVLGLGVFYALLTLGIALLFGILGLMNFAYGETIMVGAVVLLMLKDSPWWVSWPLAIVAAVFVSVLTERIAFRSLRDADPVTLMIASFAVSSALQAIARMTALPKVWGVPPEPFLQQSISVLGARISMLQILTLVLSALMIGLLALVMQRSSLGMQLRAAAEDFEMAKVLGVRGSFVIMSAFAITGAIAAVSAIVLVAKQGAVGAEMGLQPLLIGVVGAVVGGMRSLKGAALGGMLLGMSTVLLETFLPTDLIAFRDAFLYAAVIGVLVIRPQGLLAGVKVRVS